MSIVFCVFLLALVIILLASTVGRAAETPNSSHLYGYLQNNPDNWVDPMGLLIEVVIWQPTGGGAHLLDMYR